MGLRYRDGTAESSFQLADQLSPCLRRNVKCPEVGVLFDCSDGILYVNTYACAGPRKREPHGEVHYIGPKFARRCGRAWEGTPLVVVNAGGTTK